MASITLEYEASELEKHCQDVETVIIHKDRLFTAADDGKVKIWSMKDLSLLKEFVGHDYAILHLLVMGDDTLFTASIDQTVKAWQMDTFVNKGTFTGHEEGIHRLATDGKFLYSGDEKGEVRQWTKEGQLCLVFGLIEEIWDMYVIENLMYTIRDKDLVIAELKDDTEKYSIIFTHHGRGPLLVKGNTIIFLDRTGMEITVIEKTSTGFQKKLSLKKHEMIVTALASWSHFLVSSGYDGQIHLWDLDKGNCIASSTIKMVPSAMTATEDGRIFVVGSDGYLAKFKTNVS